MSDKSYKFIEYNSGRLIVNLFLFKLKLNMAFSSNKIYYKDSSGKKTLLRKPPKGLDIRFHGQNSTVIISDKDTFALHCEMDIYNKHNSLYIERK